MKMRNTQETAVVICLNTADNLHHNWYDYYPVFADDISQQMLPSFVLLVKPFLLFEQPGTNS